MTDKSIPVTVRILEKEYKIACPEGEHKSLLASAELLNKKMKDIQSKGKIIGAERIAVMAAINIAHDLIESQQNIQAINQDEISDRLDAIQVSLGSVLKTTI